MTSDLWRERTQKRLDADMAQLRAVEAEIEKLRRLQSRLLGAIEARAKDLQEDAALDQTADMLIEKGATEQKPIKAPVLALLRAAGSSGIMQAHIQAQIGAGQKNLNVCLWRMEQEMPPGVRRKGGRVWLAEYFPA